MRQIILLAGCVVAGWYHLGTSCAAAQAPPSPTSSPYSVAPDFTMPRPEVERAPSFWEERPTGAWGADLVLGLPSGVRLFHQLGAPGGLLPEVEGFAGLYFIFPTAGAGLRWSLAPLSDAHNALVLRPGIDGYALQNPLHGDGWLGGGPRGFGMITGDIDMIWQHHFDRRWSGEFGLKAGAGVLCSSTRSTAVPIGAVFIGFRH